MKLISQSSASHLIEGAIFMDYKHAAQQVLDAIGGASNIV